MAKIAVVGGGISGLATAAAIEERAAAAGQSIHVTVVEGDRRLGGKIQSDFVDGFLCETGPLGFVDNKPPVRVLVEQVGLTSELVPSNDNYSKRYVYVDRRLQLLPMSPPAAIKTKMISWRGKLRALWELRTKPSEPGKDESIAEFARRHLGKEIADKLVSAMVVGVFAGDAEALSVKSCFPVMLELEKEGDGSLIRAQMRRRKAKRVEARGPKSEGMVGSGGKLTTFKEGMGQMIARLKSRLKGDVLTGVPASSVGLEDGRYAVKLTSGETIVADAVVLATPAYAAAGMLEGLNPDISDLVDGIPYVPVNVVVSGYDKAGLGHDLEGFGMLVPKREKRGILGTLFNSSIFEGQAPEGKVALRTMIGGAINPEATKLDDEATVTLVQKELHDLLGVAADPVFVRVIRHERAIPQYVLGHGARMEKIEGLLAGHPGLFLTGNAYRGVGFNDCVVNAGELAERVLDYLSQARTTAGVS